MRMKQRKRRSQSSAGFKLEYDAARKIAQGLGASSGEP